VSGAQLVVLLAVSLAFGATAEAKTNGVEREAQRRFVRANKQYNEGHYEEALRLYQAAYDLVADPAILYNLGLAREKMFDYEGCATAFQQYIDNTRDDATANVDAADKRRRQCEERTLIPVRVSSWPPGAAVHVDDGDSKAMLGRAPATLELKPGHYEIIVEMPGYATDKRVMDVEVGRRSNADFTLERLSSLSIEADVSGASVKLDDEPWKAAPLSREVPAGLYRVIVRKPGHRDVERQVRVEAGQQKSLVLSLPALPKKRRVVVVSDVAALASIDGADAVETPAAHELLAGQHHVEVRAPGYLPFVADIPVPDDADIELHVDLSPKRSKTEKVLLWGFVGSAGASAAGGTVFGLLARSDQDAYMSGPTPELLERGESRARTADVLWGTAAALSATAVVYYLVTRPKASKSKVVR